MNLLGAIGQARPVSDFINTAGQFQQRQSNLETQKLQQQALQSAALQAEKDNKEYHIDGAVSLYPEPIRPHILKALKMGGMVSPEGIVRGKDMRSVPDLLNKFGLLPAVYQSEYDNLAAENEKLGKKGDDESRQKALANASEMAVLKKLIEGPSKEKEEKVQAFDTDKDVWKGDTKIASGVPKPPTEPKDAINDFNVFYRGQKEQNPNATEAQISQAWHELKTKEAKAIGESRIPGYSAAPAGLPPGYAFNRRTGNYEWKGDGPAPGADLASVATDYSANKKSLDTQVKIRDSMQSYVQNMKEQANRLKSIAGEVTRLDTRLLNVPIRKWGMSVKGTAAEAKVNMYLTEISSEIGKLATGSTASVQELSQSAREKWEKIHDPNMSIKEMIKLLEETQKAGDLRIKSVNDVVRGIESRIGRGGQGASAPTADPYGIR